MVTITEDTFTLPDGLQAYRRTWKVGHSSLLDTQPSSCSDEAILIST
jgi:hypothetical protein